MNKVLFNNTFNSSISLLSNIGLSEKELLFRKNRLEEAYSQLINDNEKGAFYSQLHEIKSIDYFYRMKGNLKISEDSRNQAGIDLVFNGIQVEFVTATVGNTETHLTLVKSGFNEYNRMIDGRQKHEKMMLRFASVLKDKSKKFLCDLHKDRVTDTSAFVIFMSMGELEQEWNHGEYCIHAFDFLAGKGPLEVVYNPKNIQSGYWLKYSYKPFIIKKDDISVYLDFFGDEKNKHVSAVMLSTAQFSDEYNEDNVYMFVNPNAKKPIDTTMFSNLVIWKAFNDQYQPTKGEQILKRENVRII